MIIFFQYFYENDCFVMFGRCFYSRENLHSSVWADYLKNYELYYVVSLDGGPSALVNIGPSRSGKVCSTDDYDLHWSGGFFKFFRAP